MYNKRRAIGHKLMFTPRQPSAQSNRVSLKSQDCENETEWNSAAVSSKQLSDKFDIHYPFLLNFRLTDMDIEWFVTVWNATSHTLARRSDFPIVWNAEKLKGQITLCAVVFQGLINQRSTRWSDWGRCKLKKKKRNAPDRYLQMYNCVSCSLAQQREREREKARELKTRVHWKVRDKGEMCWSKSLSPRTFISTNYQIFPYLYLREADGL